MLSVQRFGPHCSAFRQFSIWQADGTISLLSGSNSVVECDLAKVEVAGSNPVSRSSLIEPRIREGFSFLAGLGAVAKW